MDTNSNHIRNGMNCTFYFWFPFYFISETFTLSQLGWRRFFETIFGFHSRNFGIYWHGCSVQWNGWLLFLATINVSSNIRLLFFYCFFSVVEFFSCSGEQSKELHKMKNKPTDCHILRVHTQTHTHRIFDATKCDDDMWCWCCCRCRCCYCMAFNILFCSVSLIIPILLVFFNCHVCVHNFALAFCFARQSHILWGLCFFLLLLPLARSRSLFVVLNWIFFLFWNSRSNIITFRLKSDTHTRTHSPILNEKINVFVLFLTFLLHMTYMKWLIYVHFSKESRPEHKKNNFSVPCYWPSSCVFPALLFSHSFKCH